MKHMKLPNGKRIAMISKFSAMDVYNEIYEDNPYLQDGIKITSGDTVIDIGANIGLWTQYMLDSNTDMRIYCFEPIPITYKALQENLESYKEKGIIKLFNIGLSNRTERVKFNYYPRVSTDSTLNPFDFEVQIEYFMKKANNGISKIVPLRLKRKIISVLLHYMYKPEIVECQITSLSEIIKKEEINNIDLLKIDAEGAEWEILNGIDGKDWEKIKQIAMEVHTNCEGGDDLIERIQNLLKEHGYDTSVNYNTRFSFVGVHMLYGKKTTDTLHRVE